MQIRGKRRHQSFLKYAEGPSQARILWLRKPHSFLLWKSRHYYNWHCHPHHQKVHFAALVSVIIAIFFGAVTFLFPAGFAHATSYIFSQTSWAGGADVAATANHTSNQTNWTKYYSASNATAGTTVKLASTPATAAETTATQFNAGTHSSTAESGADDAGSVILGTAAGGNTWTTLTNQTGNPTNFDNPFGVAIGTSIYVTINNGTDLYIYTPGTDAWSTGAATPETCTYGCPMTTDGTDLFLYSASRKLYKYTIASNTWAQIGATGGPGDTWPGYGKNMTYINGKIYLEPGARNDCYQPAVAIYIYSIAGDSWSTVANVPAYTMSGGCGGSLATYGGLLYVSYSSTTAWDAAAMSVYNPANGGWSTLASMPDTPQRGRTGGWLSASAGHLFIPKALSTATYYDYNILTNSWTTATDLPETAQLWDGPMIAYSGALFYLRSEDSSTFRYKYNVSGYVTSGNYISQTIDLSSKASFGNLDFNVTAPANTTIEFQLAANNDNSSWTYLGPDGTAGTYYTSTGTAIAAALNDSRYIRYKTFLTSSDPAQTSSLNDITINYSKYATSGSLISSPYDTLDPGNILHQLTWTESLPSGTDVKFQLRTAPDSGAGAPGVWSDWLGPTSTSDYYTDPAGGESVNSTSRTGANDEWMQYQVFLTTSDTAATATMTNFSLQYILNTPPTLTITNSPAESSAGVYTINYNLSDPEETNISVYVAANFGATLSAGINSTDSSAALTADAGSAYTFLPIGGGTVLIDNEMITYAARSNLTLSGLSRAQLNSAAAAHSGSAIVYLRITAGLSGDTGTVTKGNGKSILLSLGTSVSNLEVAAGTIKLVANDGNLANQVGTTTTGSLVMDSKAPAGGSIILNSRTDTLTLAASDSNSILMKISNNAGLTADGSNTDSGNWISFASSKVWTPNTAGDRTETVYILFKDSYGNTTGTISTTTPANPVNVLIQDTSNPSTSSWRLFISWDVVAVPSEGFDHYEVYRSTDNNIYSALASVSSRLTNYYVDSGLDNATIYYYKITVVDSHGNESNLSTPSSSAAQAAQSGTGLMPNGSGGGDFTPPTILSVSSGTPTTMSATITWTTDKLSNSTVGYSTDTNYLVEAGVPTMVTSHSVTLNNLPVNTKYYFRVISYDASGNKGTSENSLTQNFTTAPDTTGPVISNINVILGTTTAGVAWSTNEASTSVVHYGLTSGLGSTLTSGTLVSGHALSLSGLTSNTLYYYNAASFDAAGNPTTSATATFTTAATGYENADVTPPTISSIVVSNITDSGATITYSLNENSLGRVLYGISTDYGSGANEGNNTYETGKTTVLAGLAAATTYHYKVSATDAAANLNSSGDAVFTTLAAKTGSSLAQAQSVIEAAADPTLINSATGPKISSDGPTVVTITETSIAINWTTDKRSTSAVLYRVTGSGANFATAGDTNYARSHDVTIQNLEPNQDYEYKIQSADVSGNMTTSVSYGVTTLSGNISSVQITNVTESSAQIGWTTAALSTGTVEYNGDLAKGSQTASNNNLDRSHSLKLTNLTDATPYTFTVAMKTEKGDVVRSGAYNFTTLTDAASPVISKVQNRSALVSGSQDKVQTVITWETNKLTNSQVIYAANSLNTKSAITTPLSNDFVIGHTAVLIDLKPSTVYQYYLISKDKAGHTVQSDKYMLLTPSPNASVLDLILSGLKQAFGWTKNL